MLVKRISEKVPKLPKHVDYLQEPSMSDQIAVSGYLTPVLPRAIEGLVDFIRQREDQLVSPHTHTKNIANLVVFTRLKPFSSAKARGLRAVSTSY